MSSGSAPKPQTKTEIPKDQPAPAQAAAPIATLSSNVDPWPDYIMTAACAGGSLYSYRGGNPRIAAAAAGFSLLYFTAGRALVGGKDQFGYDLGSLTSVGLLASAIPAARATHDAYSVTMAALGGASTVANGIKSYQVRTGGVHEMETKRA